MEKTEPEKFSFSDKYIKDKKEELALNLLELFGISSFDEKKCIDFEDLNDPDTLEKIKEMVPALKTAFKISRNRSLSANSWAKSKHPGLNLLRQILKETGYRLNLINDFKGTIKISKNDVEKNKKVYRTKYIIVKNDDEDYFEKSKHLESLGLKKNTDEHGFQKTNTSVVIAFD